MVDFGVRHQRVIFFCLGVLSIAPWIVTALSEQLRSTYKPRAMERVWWFARSLVRNLLSPTSSALTGILMIGGSFTAAATEPVPKSFLLEPPTIDRRGHNERTCLLVFIHGFKGSGSGPDGTWQQFPDLVRRDDRFAACDVLAVDYPTIMFRRSLHIDGLAGWLESVYAKEFVQYEKIAVISHSMGGLIARNIAIKARLDGTPARFSILASVASPFAGASSGALVNAIFNHYGADSRLLGDMTPDSGYLSGLQNYWGSLNPRPPTLCVTSPDDAIVSMVSATYQCDMPFGHLPTFGHIAMVKPEGLRDPRYMIVMDVVADHLK